VEKAEDSVDEEISLEELKEKMSQTLVPLHQLRPPAGLATGVDVIDDFLLWKGFPQGDLTLLSGQPGTGATSLWLQTAHKVQEQKKWVAWINSDWELLPSALVHKKINLQKLLVVRKPADSTQLFWILQEMISSSLFEMIGCHLAEGSLKNHQLQKLKKLARTHQVALVFITHSAQWMNSSMFSLVIDCQGDFFTIKRAAHRPTPFTIPGGFIHADLMSQLTADTRSLLR
jgi:recombination protein RecA